MIFSHFKRGNIRGIKGFHIWWPRTTLDFKVVYLQIFVA